MKSPLWLLTVLLPLATELAAASPAANPDPDSLESLESFDDANEFEERDLEDRQGGGSRQGNRCRINRPYWYYKYPCDSSDRTGQARVGSQFSASCRYKNYYKAQQGWVRNSDKPRGCEGNWERRCS